MRTQAAKILVAEDEDGVRRIFQLFLEKKGYSVMAAEDGKAAYEIYKKRSRTCWFPISICRT